ncbi:MAG: hypothetical protein JXR88_07980 [Clostridia bacterium]|nr:hypothetical protein [Clostridia bacterium]
MLAKLKKTSTSILQSLFSMVLLLLPVALTHAPCLILWQEPELPEVIELTK